MVAIWAWHEFVVKPARLLDEVCEHANVIELDKVDEDARTALDEMKAICRDRRPIDE
jgi:signal transduction histidine kinase